MIGLCAAEISIVRFLALAEHRLVFGIEGRKRQPLLALCMHGIHRNGNQGDGVIYHRRRRR